jgi:hypothetical protein
VEILESTIQDVLALGWRLRSETARFVNIRDVYYGVESFVVLVNVL